MIKTKRTIGAILVLVLFALCLFCGCSGVPAKLEGDLIEINSSSESSEPITDFFCAGKVNKEVENDQDYFLVEFSFGVAHPESYDDIKNKYVIISAVNLSREEYFVKRIRGVDFFTEKYLCSTNGKQFNHSEIIQVPTELLEKDKGMVTISVYGYFSVGDPELAYAGAAIDIHYTKSESKIYFSND